MRKITDDERLQVSLVLAALTKTPAFHVAMLWIETSAPVTARNGYPTSVGIVCFVMEYTWGARVSPQVMALALEQAGFRIAARNFINPRYNNYELAVNIRRSSINENAWRTETPNPARWAWVNDAAAVPGVERLYNNLFDRH